MRILPKSEKIRQNLDAVAAAKYFSYVTAKTYFSIGNTNAPEFSRYDANRRIYFTLNKVAGILLTGQYANRKYSFILNGDRDNK